MAGTRISQFPNLSSGDLASEDVLLVVDISDTFYSPSGTNKSTTVGDLSNFFSSANDFVGLGDTPAGYGSVGQSVVVGSDGSSLVFSGITAEAGSSTFADLTDTVSSLGNEGQVVVVSGTTLAFEYLRVGIGQWACSIEGAHIPSNWTHQIYRIHLKKKCTF